MKIGIIKETKTPVDNRVAFTPEQLKRIKNKFGYNVIVQNSDLRAFSNKEYEELSIVVNNDVSSCNYLFGIKEVAIDALIPDKHYFFFAHVGKKQEYNRPLLKKMMELGITLTDYEYIIDENCNRLVAFGWWAGVVGVYNTLRAYGLKYSLFELEKPHLGTTLNSMIEEVSAVEIPKIAIAVTGNGRVSQGAQYLLNQANIAKLNFDAIRKNNLSQASYFVLSHSELVKHNNPNTPYSKKDFSKNPENYQSRFMEYAPYIDIFIPCHFWGENDPVYLNKTELNDPGNKIKVIGDVTCDIMGGIKSTLRASTHDEPFYDYNPKTRKEETPFSSTDNITVMAVDTLPNALPIDTSHSFGEQLLENIIPFLNNDNNEIIERATILRDGKLTEKFAYLKDFVEKK